MAKVLFGADIEGLRGAVGNEIYTESKSGPVVRAKPTYGFPVTPAQQGTADIFTQALEFFKALTRQEFLAWNKYAKTLTRSNPVNGKLYTPSAVNVYTGLTCKFLQINQGGDPPVAPPNGPFVGENFALTATGGAGFLTFRAGGANHAPAMTELLLQKLPSPHRLPTKTYISQAFWQTGGAGAAYSLFASAGIYVPAYRFVNSATGQMTAMLVLPEVVIS